MRQWADGATTLQLGIDKPRVGGAQSTCTRPSSLPTLPKDCAVGLSSTMLSSKPSWPCLIRCSPAGTSSSPETRAGFDSMHA
jgi:hypothetical protein